MEVPALSTSSYRVEVSGWDAFENFFVEKTIVDWCQGEQREVRLCNALREGSVVFIRLLQPFARPDSFPIAYKALVVKKDARGMTRARLARLDPCVPRKDADRAAKHAPLVLHEPCTGVPL